VCRITSGVIWIFQNDDRFPVRSVVVINVSLLFPSSATVKMDNEENMENARYANMPCCISNLSHM
jgi:hypothetical protein